MAEAHVPRLQDAHQPDDQQLSSFLDDVEPTSQYTYTADAGGDHTAFSPQSLGGHSPQGDPLRPDEQLRGADMPPFNLFNRPKGDPARPPTESSSRASDVSEGDGSAPLAQVVHITSGARLTKQPPMHRKTSSLHDGSSIASTTTSPARTRHSSPASNRTPDPHDLPSLQSAQTLAIKVGLASTIQNVASLREANNLQAPSTVSLVDTQQQQNDQSPRKLSRVSANLAAQLTQKVFALTHDGYILQFADRGGPERQPERIHRLTPDSYAIASDLVVGKPYAIEVADPGNPDGAASDSSFLKRVGLKNGASKKITSISLLVLESSNDLEEWMAAIRKEIHRVTREAVPPKAQAPPPITTLPPLLPPITGLSSPMADSSSFDWGDEETRAARADSPQQHPSAEGEAPLSQSANTSKSSGSRRPINFIADDGDTSDDSEDIDDIPTVAQLYHEQQVKPGRLSTSTVSSHRPSRDGRSHRTHQRISDSTTVATSVSSSIKSNPNVSLEPSPEKTTKFLAMHADALPAARNRVEITANVQFSDPRKDSLAPLGGSKKPSGEDGHHSRKRSSHQVPSSSSSFERPALKSTSSAGSIPNTSRNSRDSKRKIMQMTQDPPPARIERRSSPNLPRAALENDEYHAFQQSLNKSGLTDDEDDDGEALILGVEEEGEEDDDLYHAFHHSLSNKPTSKSSGLPKHNRKSFDQSGATKEARVLGAPEPPPTQQTSSARNSSAASLAKKFPLRLPLKGRGAKASPSPKPSVQQPTTTQDQRPITAQRSPLAKVFSDFTSQYSKSQHGSAERLSVGHSDTSQNPSGQSSLRRNHSNDTQASQPAPQPPAEQAPQQPASQQQEQQQQHEHYPQQEQQQQQQQQHQEPFQQQTLQHPPPQPPQVPDMQQQWPSPPIPPPVPHYAMQHPAYHAQNHYAHMQQAHQPYAYDGSQAPPPGLGHSYTHPAYAPPHHEQFYHQHPYATQPPAMHAPYPQYGYTQPSYGTTSEHATPYVEPVYNRNAAASNYGDINRPYVRPVAVEVPRSRPVISTSVRSQSDADAPNSPSFGLLPGNIPFMPPFGAPKASSEREETSTIPEAKTDVAYQDDHNSPATPPSDGTEVVNTGADETDAQVTTAQEDNIEPAPVEDKVNSRPVVHAAPRTDSGLPVDDMGMKATVTGPVEMFLSPSDFAMPATSLPPPSPPPKAPLPEVPTT